MRFKSTSSNLKIYAVTGTHSILLSFDLNNIPNNLLGFALERTDIASGKITWLNGQKCFQSLVPNPKPGQQYPSQLDPIQSFLWKDFTADPGMQYQFKITAVTGTPQKMDYSINATITVFTEAYTGGMHSVIFNRGVAGSQAYAEKFGNKKPDDLPGAVKDQAYAWLSNGLYENLCAFVNQAKDSTYTILCAFYEFHYLPFLEVLKAASDRGVNVKIAYGAIPEYKVINENAIQAAGIGALCTPRVTQVKQPHNKFMVLLKDGLPIQVSTGSTNISPVGIFGHSNAQHITTDAAIAQEYVTYWNKLVTDPDRASFIKVVEGIQPDLAPQSVVKSDNVFFSPRSSTGMLTTYAGIMDEATDLVCAVYPFNVDKAFQSYFSKAKTYLRYVLLNQHAKDNMITPGDKNLEIVAGSYIKQQLDQWVVETNAKSILEAGIVYIHNKFILKDPLSAHPVTITGSANFSEPSLTGNDENTLIILDDLRSADIYFTEFIRLFDHFSFREWVNQDPKDFKPFLDETYVWFNTYVKDQNSPQYKRRVMFSNMANAKETA